MFDIRADPMEQNNLIHDPAFAAVHRKMEATLYQRMANLGGMDIPMNAPRGGFNNKRLRQRDGEQAADFPSDFVVDEPINRNAN